MSITTELDNKTDTDIDKLRHDFKGNLRKAKIIYDMLDEQIKNASGVNQTYIVELENTITILLRQCQKLRSKVIS
ncbi:MAG: hypothetical protein HQK49_17145 [Oligoflexia bacterium]|nr:hypothetical protein [Oligoflexia bacterium]